MKKLIPALCMRLVAACLMGTSTYAWFSAGTTVTAEGMAITATSSGGLAIATSSSKNATLTDAAFTSTKADVSAATAWNNGTTTVAPVSANGDAWYTAKAKAADSYEADGGYTPVAASTVDTASGKAGVGYFHHSQVYVKTLNQNATSTNAATLYVSKVTVTQGSGGNELEKALRVAFECDGKWVIFAPNQATGYAGKHTDGTQAVAYTASDAFVVGTTGTSSTAALDDLAYGKDAYTTVNVYLYYEGEDENCKTVYAVNLAEVKLTVEFSATVPTAP